MTRFAAFVLIITARLIYQPEQAPPSLSPFTSPSPLPAAAMRAVPARFISFTGSLQDRKVILEWTISENETADQFAVEKSRDGKVYAMAALVFGTDKPVTDKYQFYEKAGNQRILYRIRLINKNKETEFSPVVEINPFMLS